MIFFPDWRIHYLCKSKLPCFHKKRTYEVHVYVCNSKSDDRDSQV